MTVRRNDPAPIYLQVKQDLQRAIEVGQYSGETALPDERSLAVKLGVSRVTVRRALGELEGAGLVRRIPGRGTFATQAVNADQGAAVISAPVSTGSRTIVLLAPGGHPDPQEALFYFRLVRSIQAGCPQNIRLSLQSLDGGTQEVLAKLRSDESVAGMIVMELGDPATVTALAKSGIPAVVCDCCLPEQLDFDVVRHANEDGGYAGTSALIESGHERLAHIYYATSNDAATAIAGQISQERRRGFERALHSRGLPIRPEWVLPALPASSCGYVVSRRLLSLNERPTALFCSTDEVAVGAIAAARDLGVKVPEQLSIVGYGDLGLFTAPSLSTVRMEIEGSGRTALQLLLERIANPLLPVRQIVLPTQFIARASTASVYMG